MRALEWLGPPPGRADASVVGDELRLQNMLLGCSWNGAQGTLRPVHLVTRHGRRVLDLTDMEPFRLTLADGTVVLASQLQFSVKPTSRKLRAQPNSTILAERLPGQEFTAVLVSTNGNLEVEWHALLRDDANAIRQQFVFRARTNAIAIREIRLVELSSNEVKVVGTVPGSPLVVANLFLAYEHPDARSVIGELATCSLAANLTLQPGQSVVQTSVMGIMPVGQLRRGFLYYVERERAHPYRPFLHYNAWYDICWGDRKINEQECLNVISAFTRELIHKRRVPLDSFVWDDGWDDPKTLWQPLRQNFPNGFTNVLAAARGEHSTLGFWLSPFGGYGKPKEDRMALGKEQGFETGREGFSLAGRKYYQRFLETCSNFIVQGGANFFKFDGLARSVDETEAMLKLTRALRVQRPDLFISITTGTWPSPFWLWYGDSTWRGGDDMGFYGAGSKREQWMTYRDMETYRRIVQAAPFYPINSLMNQGFANARYGTASQVSTNAAEIRRELRSFFASGTCLQELYVTPARMTAQNWDDLAECARWARANVDVLVDTHWVGGDPGRGEPYGWGSWTRRKAILALRNPAAEPSSISIDVNQAFELSPRTERSFTLKSPWKEDAARPVIKLRGGQPHTIALEPFQVLVFDALPDA